MDNARRIDGKKFMWDGICYPDEKSALEALQKYKDAGFEAQLVKEEDGCFVFSRRVPKQVTVEGQTS